MRSKAIFMALLALAFGAQGASVSRETAELAACGWAQNGAALGARIGFSVESSAEHATTNGAVFYSVKMWGGGTVFMASDTEIEPVIAFTDSNFDFSELDPKSPLWALLNRDLSARRAEIDSTPVVMRPKSALLSSGSDSLDDEGGSSIADKWAALVRRGEEASYGIKRLLSAASPRQYAPDDLRVPALMTSTWDQAESDGAMGEDDSKTCYNYYTPQDDSGEIQEGKKENAVCGCVATAMGQVMFYHRYPDAATVPGELDTCWFGMTELKGSKALSMSGGPYDWANMVDSPTEDSPVEVRKAIGRLTADAGISVGMHYTTDDSGSYTFKASKSLADVFGYGQSVYASFDSSIGTTVGSLTSSKSKLGKVVFSNLDAGYPVIFGIENTYTLGGHEICADGYGYNDGTPYVHLNMGWSGECNVWYNLPNIDTRPLASLVFNAVSDAAYNIIPDGAGLGVMSGRVVDDDGDPIAAASVSVYDAGTDALVTQLVTTVHGVWGAALPEGSYNIAVSDAGKERSGGLFGVELRAPVQDDVEMLWLSPTDEIEKGIYPAVNTAADLGNSWGNDVVLKYPRVRVAVGAETNVYTTLDNAIVGARAMATATLVVPEMEILRPVELKADTTIDFDCILRAATGDVSSTLVTRPSGATVTVAAGASFLVSNCVFQSTGRVPLVAEAGGKVFVGPGFVAERVAATDANGFNVVDCVTSALAVECADASDVGDSFGWAYSDDPSALSNAVSYIYATFDATGETRGALTAVAPGTYRLEWAGVPVPVEAAAGYYVKADGTTNTFMVVDALFKGFAKDFEAGLLGPSSEIVFVGGDVSALSCDVVVSCPLVIRSEFGARLAPTMDAHIIVANGGNLVVTGVTIDGTDRKGGDTFVRVLEGGSMTLGAGARIANIECTGGNADNAAYGPVVVFGGGTLRLETGSAIIGCSASGTSSGCMHGGGVYVYGGGTLDLAGGTIADCHALAGGGVFAELGANIVVSGPSDVSGNVNKKGKADDVYFRYKATDVNRIVVTNSAAGGHIGVKYSSVDGNDVDFVFATAEALASAHDIEVSAAAFFNDANDPENPARLRVASRDGTDIKWVLMDDAVGGLVPIDQDDPAEMALAVAKVDYPDRPVEYWKSVQDAFASLADYGVGDAATVTLLNDDWFDEDVEVGCQATLKSQDGSRFTVTREADVGIEVAEGASLSVKDVDFTDLGAAYAESPFFAVDGGSLDLDAVTVVGICANGRFGAAVNVVDGEFTMHNGSTIADSYNICAYIFDRTAYAAAVLAKRSEVVLEDCAITNCVAYRVGGVCAGNGSVVYISGEADVSDNVSLSGADANITVSADSRLVLAGVLDGDAGVRRDIYADKPVFGAVGDSFSGSDADLVSSAMNFTSDDGWGYGVAVRSAGGETLLVWSERLGNGGTYVAEDGTEYSLVASPAVPFPVEPPTAAQGLVYNGEEQTGVEGGFGYTLANATATAAGDYVATATLVDGCVWTDDTTAPKDVDWSIAKAEFDMGGVAFPDKTFVYDGTPRQIFVEGDLPDGVTVSYVYDYSGNDWSQPGRYTVTASFSFEGEDYKPIPDMVATLTIVREVAAPAARTGLVYNAAVQEGVPAGDGFTLFGDTTGQNAGTDYTAVARLDDLAVWEDGTTDDLEIVWSIDPAPLTVVASDAWKYVGNDDPLTFAYTVEGLQGDDTAADVLVGALERVNAGTEDGERVGAYAITQGDLAVADGVSNYFIESFRLGTFRIRVVPTSVLPDLPPGATPADVELALAEAGLADGDVAAGIVAADDPVAAYDSFKEWANAVTGGEEAVAASDHAWVSYEFGVTDLFENDPVVSFTSMAIEDPATASMNVKLVVKDGTAEKDVDPDSVARLFEMSTNLVTWTDDVTATPNPDGSYTVKPNDPALSAAFIRLKY